MMYAKTTRFATRAADTAAEVVFGSAEQASGLRLGFERVLHTTHLPPQTCFKVRKYVPMGPKTIATVKTPSLRRAAWL